MTTPTVPNREIKTVMHPIKARQLTVKKIENLSNRLRRITFTSEDLKDFVSLSADDHVKVFFPYPGEDKPVVPTFGPNGPSSPDGRKPIMRDYTPRSFNNESLELDIEFVLHGEGVGSQWAETATVGQQLTVAGPRASKVIPYSFDWYLMIGDESAIPSFARRFSEIPAHSKAIAIIEVEDESQKINFETGSNIEIHWVYRQNQSAGNAERFKNALLNLNYPVGDYFAWIACEKACAMELRDFLVTVRGAEDQWVKATGYWTLTQES